MILGTAYRAELAPDGKIIIPDTLRKFANLHRDVIMIGQGDFLELWSPEDWDRQNEQLLNVDANHFSTLNITTR
jgi:MraZ protein